MTSPAVTVERVEWSDVDDRLRADMLRLNLASRRQCAFFTPEYIDAGLAHSEEFGRAKVDAFVLVARSIDGDVIGVLPLRRTWNTASVPFRQIAFLASSEVDLPDVIAAEAHEAAVADALMRYLPKLLGSASAVHLPKLSAQSALFPQRSSAGRWWAPLQEGPGMPVSHIPVGFESAQEYFGALSKRMRSNVSRLGRRLAAAGRLEMLCASAGGASSNTSSGQALLDVFEVYLQLEDRSWKRSTEAAIRRHDERAAMFRALFATADAVEHHIDLITVDDVPVAGLISMSLGSSSVLMETCYDERFAELSPSNLLIFLAVERAIRAGNSEVSLHGHFDYYKHRWLAEMVETCDVRLVRPASVPHLRTRVGALARRVVRGGERTSAIPSGHRENPAMLPSHWQSEALEAVRAHPAVGRFDSATLNAMLPFDIVV